MGAVSDVGSGGLLDVGPGPLGRGGESQVFIRNCVVECVDGGGEGVEQGAVLGADVIAVDAVEGGEEVVAAEQDGFPFGHGAGERAFDEYDAGSPAGPIVSAEDLKLEGLGVDFEEFDGV